MDAPTPPHVCTEACSILPDAGCPHFADLAPAERDIRVEFERRDRVCKRVLAVLFQDPELPGVLLELLARGWTDQASALLLDQLRELVRGILEEFLDDLLEARKRR